VEENRTTQERGRKRNRGREVELREKEEKRAAERRLEESATEDRAKPPKLKVEDEGVHMQPVDDTRAASQRFEDALAAE
jgi:hypothetical protein